MSAEDPTPLERIASIRATLAGLGEAERDYQEAGVEAELSGHYDSGDDEAWTDSQLGALNALLADLDPLLTELEAMWGVDTTTGPA